MYLIRFGINVKKSESEIKNKKMYRRNKGTWNNMLRNKTAIECWDILKYEIESIVDKSVPLKKQGRRSRKKHLSKEAIKKILFKQTIWRVYRHTLLYQKG